MLILITILLVGSTQPFFPLVDTTKGYRYIWNLLTTAGWIYVASVIAAVVLSVVVEMKADKEATETRQTLSDIKSAIEKSGAKYDSSKKTLIYKTQ